MRAVLITLAFLLMSNPMLAQQRKQATILRTFVPDEPQPCIVFDRMAARLDAVYTTEEISKADYDVGMKKYDDGTAVEGVDYFSPEKGKYQRAILQQDKLADFIRWYAGSGGRRQMAAANANCNTEMAEREERYWGIYELRQLQDAMTVSQAEGLLADVALEGQNLVIKALLESESAHKRDIERYNRLVDNVNSYNKAVNDLVVTVNTAMSEPKGSKLAPTLSFNYVRLQPLNCSVSTIPFSDSTAYMVNMRTVAKVTPIECE